MNAIQSFDHWLDSIKPPPAWMDAVRFGLGGYLFYKGFVFTINFESLNELIATSEWFFAQITMGHYISIVHLAGGLLIALGAFTRSNCMMNIPILLGAVLINYDRFLTVDDHMGLINAIVVLALLIVFFIVGGGRYSVDELRRRDKEQKKLKSSTPTL